MEVFSNFPLIFERTPWQKTQGAVNADTGVYSSISFETVLKIIAL